MEPVQICMLFLHIAPKTKKYVLYQPPLSFHTVFPMNETLSYNSQITPSNYMMKLIMQGYSGYNL